MKPTVIVVMTLLLLAGLAFAQASAAQHPAAQQPAAQQPAAPAAAQPAKKGPPMAKTQDEFKAYTAAAQKQQGQPATGQSCPAGQLPQMGAAGLTCFDLGTLPAAEAAADQFVAQYPQSDLRVLLYQSLMNLYQSANNGDKVVEIGRKVVAMDADNSISLVMIATVLAERTRDTDLDKDERLAEAIKDAKHALETMDNLSIPPGTPPDRVLAAKSTISSMAYGALGTVATIQQNWPEAEQQLRKSVEAPGINPDPLTMLRLCITLDHLKKYAEALQMANQTVETATRFGQTAVQQLAQQERDRLVKLTAGPPPAAAPPAAAAPTPPAAPPAKPPQEF